VLEFKLSVIERLRQREDTYGACGASSFFGGTAAAMRLDFRMRRFQRYEEVVVLSLQPERGDVKSRDLEQTRLVVLIADLCLCSFDLVRDLLQRQEELRRDRETRTLSG
jgi:hypothetical protein